MPKTHSYLFKRAFEFIPIDKVESLPPYMRGIYVLYHDQTPSDGKHYNVVYVGMARGDKAGAKGRLLSHRRKKKDLWTHCSVFEVWDNIFPEQVEELEGLFRHFYRYDIHANNLNKQKAHAPLDALARETEKDIAKNSRVKNSL